jgi:hypothetical protein
MNAQLGCAQELFGPDATTMLLRTIEAHDRSGYYLGVQQRLIERMETAHGPSRSNGAVLQYVIWAALQATTFPGARMSAGPSSMTLFYALLEQIIRDGSAVDLPSAIASIDGFYDAWGFIRPLAMIERTAASIEQRLGRLQTAYANAITPGQHQLAAAHLAFARAYAAIGATIRERPEVFFETSHYPWACALGLLPSIHVAIRTGGEILNFLTHGPALIPFDSWILLTESSTAFQILVKGRRRSGLSFYEDRCYADLVGGSYRLRFADRLFD